MINKQRFFLTLLAITVLLTVLAGKLFMIQIVQSRHYSAYDIDLVGRSVGQRGESIVLDSGRGRFMDRNHIPLTGEYAYEVAVFPRAFDHFRGNHENLALLLDILHITKDEWKQLVSDSDRFHVLIRKDSSAPLRISAQTAEQVNQLHIAGLYAIQVKMRYMEPYHAGQLIGYMSQNPERMKTQYDKALAQGHMHLDTPMGASGLELAFEPLIQSKGKLSLQIFMDGKRELLGGLNPHISNRIPSFYPVQAITTIDSVLQARIENLLDSQGITQASIVLQDPANGDILAMVNRPSFNPNQPNPNSINWVNRALRASTPGSVFKIIIAIAALENHVVSPDEYFECNGEYGKFGFSCWKPGGHGHIRLQEAFSESCNIVFAEIAKRLTAGQIEKTARKLGLEQRIGWQGEIPQSDIFSQFADEDTGEIFAPGVLREDEGLKIQTAIGQRDVRLTPLQAANLVVALLHQGALVKPRIVSEIQYEDGATMLDFPTQQGKASISYQTASLILQWMRQTVLSGTGSALAMNGWQLAGKTGTAQASTNGQQLFHQWFVGYGPVQQPQAAGAVVIYDQKPGSAHSATRLFGEIMDIVRQGHE